MWCVRMCTLSAHSYTRWTSMEGSINDCRFWLASWNRLNTPEPFGLVVLNLFILGFGIYGQFGGEWFLDFQWDAPQPRSKHLAGHTLVLRSW